MSLITVIVALGMAAVLGLFVARTMKTGMGAQSRLEVRGAASEVRRNIVETVDCATSFPTCGGATPCTCPAGTPSLVTLRRRNNTVAIPNTGARVGKIVVRASCETIAGVTGIVPRYARIRDGAAIDTTNPDDFLPDKLNPALRYDWSNPKNHILESGQTLCSGYFAAPVVGACPAGSLMAAGEVCGVGEMQTGFLGSVRRACCRALVNGPNQSLTFWDQTAGALQPIPGSRFNPTNGRIGYNSAAPTALLDVTSPNAGNTSPLLSLQGLAANARPVQVDSQGYTTIRNNNVNTVASANPFALRVNMDGSEWGMALFENQANNSTNGSRIGVVARQNSASEGVNVAAVDLANNSAVNPAWWHLTVRGNGELRFQHQQRRLNEGLAWDRAHYRFTTDGRMLMQNCTSASSCTPLRQSQLVAISDRRLKRDIETLDTAGVVARLSSLRGYRFRYNDALEAAEEGSEPPRHLGVIAQEVQKAFPELVKPLPDGDFLSVDYESFAAVFIEAFRSVFSAQTRTDERLDALEQRIAQQDERIEKLLEENARLRDEARHFGK